MPRRKETDNVRKLRGTDRPCRAIGENVEYESLTEMPEPFDWMNNHAVTHWYEVGNLLISKKVITEADLPSFADLCMLQAKIIQASIGGVDLPVSVFAQVRQYQAEFGMTPASRAKIKVGDNGSTGNQFARNGKKNA